MKEKRDSKMMRPGKNPNPRMTSTSSSVGMMIRSSQIEIHEMGSALEVVLITGLDCQPIFNEIIRLIHEEEAEVVNASFSTVGDTVFHTIHCKVGESSGFACGASRIAEKLKKYFYDAGSLPPLPSYLSIPPSFPPSPTAFQDDAQAAILSDLVAWLHTGGSSLALFNPFDAALYSVEEETFRTVSPTKHFSNPKAKEEDDEVDNTDDDMDASSKKEENAVDDMEKQRNELSDDKVEEAEKGENSDNGSHQSGLGKEPIFEKPPFQEKTVGDMA
ncbi:hypothetical protein RHGRI_004660 [Rhododendron griersonianum]|uniref:Uncharacterized protein n=1 Tax=Rhododendron griersonianum TaxID=479676 RepID=A0AAV6L9F8_9ERIC|nr:hypothetical protein RHGRI_004660 [Rhododendron griersonianum]